MIFICSEQTIEAERGKTQSRMKTTGTCNATSIYDTLFDLFEKAISAVYPNISNPPVIITSSNNPKFGDYQCNSAMPLSKQLSSIGMKLYYYEQGLMSKYCPY